MSARWIRAIVVILALVEAGWLTFDGARALVMGDYVTPRDGDHAGRLGPWSGVLAAVGIPPRATAVKAGFLLYGLAWLVSIAAFWSGARWSWQALVILAGGMLWYLPIGTVLGLIQIALLMLLRGPA